MDFERLYCNTCRNSTKHKIVYDYHHKFYEYFWADERVIVAQILMCLGCEDLSFKLLKHPFAFEEKVKIEEFIYPDRNSKKRDRIYFPNLPKQLSQLYNQTLSAYDQELNLLAASGLRSLLEGIVVNKIEASEYSNNLESKIESLRKFLNDEVIDTLHDFRFMGNEAIHALKEPDRTDIHRALNVMENILTYFFNIEHSAKIYKRLKRKEK